MNFNEMSGEMIRLYKLLDNGIEILATTGKEMADHEHALRKAVAIAWATAPKGTVPQREAWVESETADQQYALDVAEAQRQTALEAVRSRRTQISALQSLLSAYKAEAELAR